MHNSANKKYVVIGCLAAIGCEVLFGLSYAFTKQVTGMTSPMALLGWRFVVAFAVINLLRLCGIVKIILKGKNKKQILIVALLNPVIYFIGEVYGIKFTTSSEVGVFYACFPIFTIIASTLILRKKPEKRQIAGIAVTLTGVMITVMAVGMTASMSVKGYAFMVLGLVSYSLYSVFVEKAHDYTDIEITYMMLAAGAAVYGAAALIEATAAGNMMTLVSLPFTSGAFLTAILYQGIGCSILAFLLANVAINKIGVNRMASFIGISTVVSIITGVVALGEPFSKMQIAGAIVILAGVYTANVNLKKRQ